LSDPLLLVSSSGEILDANPAFDELVRSHGVSRDLTGLFGPGAAAILDQARSAGHVCIFLPLVVGPRPHPTFRVSLDRCPPGDRFVGLLVDMSDEIAWRRKLFERNRVLTVLNDLGAALSTIHDVETLVTRIHEQIGRIMRTTDFFVALFDRDANTLSFPIYIEDGRRRPAFSRPFANGMSEHVLRTAAPLFINRDVLAKARALGIDPVGRPSDSWLGVPILVERDAVGLIAIQEATRADAYEESDLEVLTIIAGQAAAAIENIRLLGAARRAYQELSDAQSRLLESERLRGVTETVGALNHEVNNPLAAISGNAQLLLRPGGPLPEGLRPKVEAILEAALRIQRVTARMASLIHATSMPYPGQSVILDVTRSRSSEEAPGDPSAAPAA
jgi:GAF domain-containing protein